MASGSNHHHHHHHHHNFILDKERSKLFPLKSITDVVKFFRCELESGNEPDLTALSIVAGFIENTLTSGNNKDANTTGQQQETSVSSPINNQTIGGTGTGGTGGGGDGLGKFPIVTYDTVETLYKKFQNILSVVEKPKSGRNANRNVIKKVSDIIWHSLIRSTYKDRAHLQNLYSYLSGNKLDCFGVALAVVAGCQLLGYKDVHLAISEDHAWVVFGKNRQETVEVTWHGKGHEDKRGQDVNAGVESRSWLYLAGQPVICDRYMEVATIVSAINISLTLTSDCLEVADLQQNLLWLLYDMGYLKKYPMALGNLGELEESSPTDGRQSCEELYKEAIQSSRQYYKNHHVYPYIYQGGYYYRQPKYREAFASWANAGDVIRLYNYSRDDEEIYKQFLDIANEMIPYVMKTESSGHSAKSILRDSECFANLLRFYDGICQWEEGSLTPILHIGWAKPLVNTISKFDYDIRSQVAINIENDDDDHSGGKKQDGPETRKLRDNDNENTNTNTNSNSNSNNANTDVHMDEGNNNCIKKEEVGKKSDINQTLADLTAACGEKILNPDFLLQGGGQPFADQKIKKSEDINDSNTTEMTTTTTITTTTTTTTQESDPVVSLKTEMMTTTTTTTTATPPTTITTTTTTTATTKSEKESNKPNTETDDTFEYKPKRPIITLFSQKMKGLKDLLLSEKLNTQAISLQVTAQSQVAGKKARGTDKIHHHHHHQSHHNNSSETEVCTRPKRTRRE